MKTITTTRTLTLVNVRLFRVQFLSKLLVRVRLDREGLADCENLSSDTSAWGNGEAILSGERRTLKRNGRSSPNFSTTLSPRSSG